MDVGHWPDNLQLWLVFRTILVLPFGVVLPTVFVLPFGVILPTISTLVPVLHIRLFLNRFWRHWCPPPCWGLFCNGAVLLPSSPCWFSSLGSLTTPIVGYLCHVHLLCPSQWHYEHLLLWAFGPCLPLCCPPCLPPILDPPGMQSDGNSAASFRLSWIGYRQNKFPSSSSYSSSPISLNRLSHCPLLIVTTRCQPLFTATLGGSTQGHTPNHLIERREE